MKISLDHVADQTTLFDQLARHLEVQAEVLFISDGTTELTWKAFADLLAGVSRSLRVHGVGPGSVVALLSENSAAYMAVFLGAVAAGCAVVTLPTLQTRETLRTLVRDCAPSVLFASAAYSDLAAAICQSAEPGGPGPACLSPGCLAITTIDPCPFRAEDVVRPQDPGSALFNIVYSSGTSGIPKGISHSHSTRLSMARGLASLGFDQQAHLLISTPLYTNLSLPAFLAAFWAGSRVRIMPRFDAQALLHLAHAARITHFFLVPVQIRRILDLLSPGAPETAASRLLYVAGSLLRETEKRRLLDLWPGTLVEAYGMTEGAPASALFLRDHPDKLATVGRAVPGCEIRIVDEAGIELGPQQTGEVMGRSGSMMLGYHNRPDATRELLWRAADGQPFFSSGDIGWIDAEGFLHLVDRRKDIIISGGLNIYASDLEEVLAQHPHVADVAVVAAPSEQWGETPVAFVVCRSPHHAAAPELLAWVNARVGKYQRVAEVHFVPELPRNALGKLLKRDLRDQLAGASGRC